jgi:hypothetical protein
VKKTLGSFILFFTLSLSLFGSSLCYHEFQVSNSTPYVKEGVEVVFHVRQVDKSKVMYFELKPQKSDDFKLHLMQKTESQKGYHEHIADYKYILFPLKSGKIELKFDFKISLATEDGVEKFYTGSRDVINPMAHEESKEELEPLVFDVKSIKDVDLVGDFQLVSTVDKKEVASYEQVNATFKLKGKGYPQKPKNLLPNLAKVESFLEIESDEKSFIKGGKVLYHYALLAENDFEIPQVEISCFSPTKKRYYKLKTDKQKIKVKQIESSNLLDSTDSYPTSAFDYSKLLPYLNALLLFLAGFISAKLDWKKYLKKDKPIVPLMVEKIAKTRDEKALLKLLLSSNKKEYKPYIKQLEESIYEQKKLDFRKLKEELSKL